ncbi:uncharacterized protein LOC123548891 [Mercenaria mercenaria]|uniref:uncharacterized protein LOC123548891 n=1 Tax=Mercenaria mercenaria TaxID=6596 RepID=UPI00234E4A4E|nr:uncharacterized protein LOC123548891 [Mercenaria mercenaria]
MPCQVCGRLYDEIIKLHRYNDPNWETDSAKWCTDHWQFAKCFMTTTSKTSNNSASETDATGLLGVIINGIFFQSYIQCLINPPYDTFSQAKKTRNDILHSSSQELTDMELTSYIQIMLSVLEDPNTLINDVAAKSATARLKQMMNDPFVITTTHETKVISNALNAIKEEREKSEERIRNLTEEKKQAIEEKTEECLARFQTDEKENSPEANADASSDADPHLHNLKTAQKDHESRLQAVEAKVDSMNANIGILKEQLATLKEAEKLHHERNSYLKCKQEFQQKLIHLYRKHFVYTSISPLKTGKLLQKYMKFMSILK